MNDNNAGVVLKVKGGDVEVHCAFDKLVKVGDLVPYPKNANQHSEHQIELLALLIGGNRKKKTKGNGWRVPITVSNQSGFIVRGHGRLEAAKKLKIKEVPVDYQDYETPELEKADRLADNQIPELAEIDMSILKGEFDDLLKLDFEMDFTGFEGDEIGRILKGEIVDDASERGIINPVDLTTMDCRPVTRVWVLLGVRQDKYHEVQKTIDELMVREDIVSSMTAESQMKNV